MATSLPAPATGARGVVVADLKSSRGRLAEVAGDIDGLAVTADVAEEADIKALIAAAEDKYGPIDIFFSNAGLSRKGQETADDADWDVSWRVHVMSHVFAARALLPGMLARGSGYLLSTASAAGLLASLNSMPYGVTKHAAVALAEHLAIQYGDRGIRVSVLCPQSVQTGMTTPGPSAARVDGGGRGRAAINELQAINYHLLAVQTRGRPAGRHSGVSTVTASTTGAVASGPLTSSISAIRSGRPGRNAR